MVERDTLVQYCDVLLDVHSYRDYCPNGLQVQGHHQIQRLVTGVTACQALLDAAVERQADAILVHHGYFWNGEDQRVVGIKQQRLSTLLHANINLLAYHLPLDGHDELGNNARLGALFGFIPEGRFGPPDAPELGWHGLVPQPCSATQLAEQLANKLGRPPLVINAHERPLQRVGWCSGAAQSYIEAAALLGLDAFISGEVSEQTVHIAREMGISYFAAGHHATERYGVMALGEHLAKQYTLDHEFVDIDNPV